MNCVKKQTKKKAPVHISRTAKTKQMVRDTPTMAKDNNTPHNTRFATMLADE
jgi:hypothetical protein